MSIPISPPAESSRRNTLANVCRITQDDSGVAGEFPGRRLAWLPPDDHRKKRTQNKANERWASTCAATATLCRQPDESAGQLQDSGTHESRLIRTTTMTKTIAIAALLSAFTAASFAATPAASAPMAGASGAMTKKHADKKHMDKKADKAMAPASAASK